jgi:hypothetical protein
MTEHESNLHDLYAGFAMLAMVMRKDKDVAGIAAHAIQQADAMLDARTSARKAQEGGIADILSKWGTEA